MKFTLSCLKDHLETDASLGEIAKTLTAVGLEVDSVVDRASALAEFTVAEVLAAEKHPSADRLQVCTVKTASGQHQVVCGAPNARAGLKGVFAPVGAYVPGIDLKLTKAIIRGVESHGMLCSEREMGISDEHQGIIELPADAEIGLPFAAFAGLDDPVIDIELTPNRPDCTGVRGIARDLAAAGLGSLKPLASIEPIDGNHDSPVKWAIADDGNACNFVVGRHFTGVKNGPSPKWLADRLTAIGLRPISALVDITNYVTMDLGRPLHVFDAARLSGDTLTMRMAKTGEKIAALDGHEYTLDTTMTVIADGSGPLAIGGVMGGEATGCQEDTSDVFLECALFDPVCVAATGRKLNLTSDARYRFERGVDPQSALWGAEVAARLITDICGGTTSGIVEAGALPPTREAFRLRGSRVADLGGIEVDLNSQNEILQSLGFDSAIETKDIQAVPPSWRLDIEGEADLVEEIVRIHGLDKVPPVSLPRDGALPTPAITLDQRRAGAVKRALALRGLYEAVTWSFGPGTVADLFGGVSDELRLENPISSDLDVMRPSIVPGLLTAAGRNIDRGQADPALFELGPQYHAATHDGQKLVAAGVRLGRAVPAHWADPARDADAIDAKADALAGLGAAGAPVDKLQTVADAPDWYHPGRSGSLRLGPNVLAWFGEIHPRILSALDIRPPAIAFEIFLDAVPKPKSKASGAARPPLHLASLQPVHRDFAFIVEQGIGADAVLRAAAASLKGGAKAEILDVRLFDVYQGQGIDPDKKSLAISVTLQPGQETLTDQEIDELSTRIVDSVVKATGGELRA
jgi:phenylalanyl-tRNA synthetase beta chain